MNIIFLDIDGVLNSHKYTLQQESKGIFISGEPEINPICIEILKKK